MTICSTGSAKKRAQSTLAGWLDGHMLQGLVYETEERIEQQKTKLRIWTEGLACSKI